MKFIVGGEDMMSYIERMAYDGVIGIFYKTTWQGVLAYLIFGLMVVLSIIGLVTVVKWFINKPTKKKETPGERWLRTGKMK